MSEKRCYICKETKPVEEFYKNKAQKDGWDNYCRICKTEQYRASRARRKTEGVCHCGRELDGEYKVCALCRKRRRIWGKNNPEKDKAMRDRLRAEKRRIVFEHYGNKCACCGESQQEFLSVDHINNDGAKHRREINRNGGLSFNIWIIRNGFPKDLQLLCYNCNCAKEFFGMCPHQKKSDPVPKPATPDPSLSTFVTLTN